MKAIPFSRPHTTAWDQFFNKLNFDFIATLPQSQPCTRGCRFVNESIVSSNIVRSR